MNVYKQITYKEAVDFLLPLHYSGRKPQIKYAFGCFTDDKLMAVCSYGVPASRSLCVGVMGKDFASSVLELNRLCRLDEWVKPLSEFVGWTLRELMKYNLCIVSYADTAMNHTGAIYQACNFLYTGATKLRTDKYTHGGKHSRHYTNEYNHLRKVRSVKHRYVYMACDKRHSKIYKNALKYKVEDYPKGEKVDYVLGDFIKPTVYDRNTDTFYSEDKNK